MGFIQGDIRFQLNGVDVNPPREWEDVQILATFDNEATQANITTDKFSWVNENAVAINDWIAGGLTGATPGIFEGMPLRIQIFNQDNTFNAFKGMIDFNDFTIISPVEVEAQVKKQSGLNELSDRLEGITFGLLESEGILTSSDYQDCNYVVQNEIVLIELVLLNISIYLLAEQIADGVNRVGEIIADSTGHATGGGPFGAIGSALYLVIRLVIETIYLAAITLALIELIKQLIELLVPQKRTHKTLSLKKGLEAIADKLGYTLITNIDLLDEIYFLPSKPQAEQPIGSGIPNVADFGYQASEWVELCRDLFNAKVAVLNDNELHFRFIGDPFWIKTASYSLPDVLLESSQYNTEDLKSNFLFSFQTDEADKYTLENFEGTNYEVITAPINISNQNNILTKGLNEVRIPCALGTRKDDLNIVETTLKAVGTAADKVINFFGGNSDFASKIKKRVGLMKVSQNIHNVPKLLYLDSDGNLPKNHRTQLRAKVFYDGYWEYESFVTNKAIRQRKVYEGVEVPFGFEDFLKLIDNSYFTTIDGKIGKAIQIKWTPARDKAIMDFWIAEVYTNNLFETKIEG